MSKPLTQFSNTILRAHGLLDISTERTAQIMLGTATEYVGEDDLIRASNVLAVAAMDLYFTAKFTDVLNLHLRNSVPSEELILLLRNAGLDTRAALEIATMQRPFRRIRTMVQKHLSLYTSHRVEAIDKLFATLGLKGLCGRAQKKMGTSAALARIEKFVILRNDITHTGHLNSRGSVKVVRHSQVSNRIEELTTFVKCCDAIIDEFVASSE